MKEVNIVDEQPVDPEKLQVGRLAEHAEAERLASAAERLGQIERLRPEKWSKLTETERESCLRQAGRELTKAYECPAPPFIGKKMPEVEGGVLLGEYSDSDYITRMNRELLKKDDVGDALGTYSHEFRHAYQQEMSTRYNSAFRHLCHNEAQASAWSENLKPGSYVEFKEDPEKYAVQPVEADARDFADRLKDEVRRRQ